jgi:hypothetical protein
MPRNPSRSAASPYIGNDPAPQEKCVRRRKKKAQRFLAQNQAKQAARTLRVANEKLSHITLAPQTGQRKSLFVINGRFREFSLRSEALRLSFGVA